MTSPKGLGKAYRQLIAELETAYGIFESADPNKKLLGQSRAIVAVFDFLGAMKEVGRLGAPFAELMARQTDVITKKTSRRGIKTAMSSRAKMALAAAAVTALSGGQSINGVLRDAARAANVDKDKLKNFRSNIGHAGEPIREIYAGYLKQFRAAPLGDRKALAFSYLKAFRSIS